MKLIAWTIQRKRGKGSFFVNLHMTKSQVNINFEVMAKAMREHVRNKATLAGSTIIYKKNGVLIEEDPKSLRKTVLKEAVSSK